MRDRAVAELQGKSVFEKQLDSCTYEFIETVDAGTEPELNQPR